MKRRDFLATAIAGDGLGATGPQRLRLHPGRCLYPDSAPTYRSFPMPRMSEQMQNFGNPRPPSCANRSAAATRGCASSDRMPSFLLPAIPPWDPISPDGVGREGGADPRCARAARRWVVRRDDAERAGVRRQGQTSRWHDALGLAGRDRQSLCAADGLDRIEFSSCRSKAFRPWRSSPWAINCRPSSAPPSREASIMSLTGEPEIETRRYPNSEAATDSAAMRHRLRSRTASRKGRGKEED